MRPSKYPLSRNDFESGRFDVLAKFVYSNWPFNGVLTEDESKETVAKTLGYDGYSDAFASATGEPHSPSIGNFDLKENFDKLDIVQSALQEFSNAEDKDHYDENESEEDVLEHLISQFNGPTGEFLDSWPIDLVGRWNYEQNGCTFSIEFMKDLEGEFEKIWSSSNFNSNGFVSALENTNSAGSFIIQETLNHDIDSLESLAIKDILDAELCEALLQDSLPNLINEVLTVSSHDAEVLVYETGMSLADVWALPRNEDGYPSLYAHMRKYLADVVLEKRVISLFIKDRDTSGFYIPHHDYDADLEERPVYPEAVNFVFHHDRDEMDCENFRSYTWVTEARSKDGVLLAKAVGSYIHGPASRPTSGANLIFSLDQVGDYDVEIVDMVQTVLQNKIYEDDDQVVDKSDLNMQLIFGYGNLVTITHWERSSDSKPGLGLDLLGYTIDMLKKRFKRNMYVAAILDAYQYTNDGQLHPVVRNKRFHDIGKIANNLGQLHLRPHVLGVFASMRHIAEGPGAFVRHCGEAYGRHQDQNREE